MIAEIKNLWTGAQLLYDWLGDGGAVSPMVAEFRAQRCISGNNGEPCPNNVQPRSWEKHLTDPVAQAIRRQLELKHGMNLHLPDEDKLAMCKICGCCNALLVWTPTKHLREHHLKNHSIDTYPKFCWKRKEYSDTIIT
jgi:hypothetical protein